MTGHEQWDEQAAGYALDALDDAEREQFERHLADCAHCRAQVDQHALVAAQLGALVGDDDVPAPPWSAIRAGVVGTAAATSSPTTGDVVQLRPRRAQWLAAAAAVVVAAAGVTTWQATRGGGETSPLASVSACRATPGCHVVALRAGGTSPASVLVKGRAVTLVATSMPAPPAGHEWALWQVPRTGTPQLLAEFGSHGAESVLSVPYDATASFAVSKEKAGVTPAAPSTVVATGAT
jgi:anti-sigma-K factor RskA